MAKSLDGIKKLNPEEAEKYRKIVLNYIGEKDSSKTVQPANINQSARGYRSLDGLKAGKIKSLPPRQAEEDRLRQAIKRQSEIRKQVKEEEKQYLLERERREEENRSREQEKIRLEKERIYQEKAGREENKKKIREQAENERRAEEDRLKQEKIIKLEKEKQAKERAKQEEFKKKEIAKKELEEAEARAKLEEKKRWEEKIKLAEKEKEETRLAKENLRQEKIKRQAEVKRIGQELKLARQIASEKRRAKRQKAIKKFKKKLKLELNWLAFALKKNYVYIISFFLLFLITAYSFFCAAVLRFQLNDNVVVERLTSYLPVPAVITSQGIINFQDFKSLKNQGYSGLTLDQKKNYLAAWLAKRNLNKKYGLPLQASAEDLAIKFVLDQDFNEVGLTRINKISELLGIGNQLEQLGKYADEYNDGAYYSENEAARKFGPAALDLSIGQASGIIGQASGYYIIKRIKNDNGRFGVKHIFVGARTLEQYLNKEIAETKIFILAN
ncbi:MAG: hypothetical protein Q7R92_02075 [bacterium]|nr:hypothetical protein [bacterium]